MTPAPVPITNARVAVVHDWLDTWAGGESCLAEILALYPHAELFSLVDFFRTETRARIGGRRAHTSFLQRLPGARRHFRRMLPLFPAAIESLDVADFDIVISSSHAVAKGVRTHRRQLHVCYCYSPVRYAWDLRDTYLAQTGLDRGAAGWLVRRVLERIRRWDAGASERVDVFVAISRHIAERIARCYGRSSAVVYPPVTLATDAATVAARTHYVTVSRLVPYKRIDLIVSAFGMLPDRELVVIGEGPERGRIESAAPPNVRLLGEVDDARRDEWVRRARAFVFAADEDFGIAPVEAQSHGTPVIAYGHGGALETIRGLDDAMPTGVFFERQSPDAIAEAIRTFEANHARIDPAQCRRNAMRFSAERFRNEFAALVEREWAAFRSKAA